VTLSDLERRNGPYFEHFTEFCSFRSALRNVVEDVEDVVVKKFTFAISYPDEFLVDVGKCTCLRVDLTLCYSPPSVFHYCASYWCIFLIRCHSWH